MISLSGDSILLRDAAGSLHPHLLTSLHQEVNEALKLVNRPDPIMADDLMRVVRHYAKAAIRSGRVLDFSEVRALVIRAIRDAGFAEAADILEPGSPGVPELDLIDCDPQAIATVLATDARFIGIDRRQLAAETAAALAATPWRRITPAAAAEIALMTLASRLQDDVPSAPAADTDSAAYWLLEGENWGGLLDGELADAVAAGQLRVHPVSRLAPVVRAVIDLRRFRGDTELMFLPAVDAVASALAPVLAQLPQLLAERSRDIRPTDVIGRIRLVGAESAGANQLKLAAIPLYSFVEDLCARVSGRMRDIPWLVVEQSTVGT